MLKLYVCVNLGLLNLIEFDSNHILIIFDLIPIHLSIYFSYNIHFTYIYMNDSNLQGQLIVHLVIALMESVS